MDEPRTGELTLADLAEVGYYQLLDELDRWMGVPSSAYMRPYTNPRPKPKPAAQRRLNPPPDFSDDPLHEIPAEEYVEAPTGEEVGRKRKISCPFHSDSEPSLHVYDDHWVCFSCRRGGTAIDLAAELHGVEPRGRGYHELRRLIGDKLLGLRAAA